MKRKSSVPETREKWDISREPFRLGCRLDDLAIAIKSTELESYKERKVPQYQNEKPNPKLNEGDSINQSQRKDTLIKFSNQSHRQHSDIDKTVVEQSQKINEYKSISTDQLYQSIWKNPPADIFKDTEIKQNYSKIVNSQCSYDTVYKQLSINQPTHLQSSSIWK